MKRVRDFLKGAPRQVEGSGASDQLRRRSIGQRGRRLGMAGLALAIAAGGFGVARVAFAHQGASVVSVTHRSSDSPSPSPSPSPAPPALCSNTGMQVSVQGTEGAAGTIRYVWRAKNISSTSCRSFGYPGMDVHGTGGWLDLQVHRGGFLDINQAPRHIVVAPGHSLYFISYWSDVTTNKGPCTKFDKVKVTLPDNFVSNVVSATGCLNPDSVDVGPVRTTVPAP